MKRHSFHSASCSCTSCVYRSRSKEPSVQQLLEDGTRIDKLYYGKYLPLRERKLLEKLIRTRAVYDDVRNQLLSTSGSSDQRSEHKMKTKRRDDDSTEKSSAVVKIVDMVDRGHIGSSNTSKLSSCCSCCSCSSLRKIKKHMEKHPRVYKHNVPYEEIARYTVEAEKRGRKRRRQLSTKISSKIRTVHFKMKKVRSEPCTCTLSLSSVIKRPSKAFLKKVRSKEVAVANTQAQKAVTTERTALKKKICSCSCKLAKIPMKSIKKIQTLRHSTKSSGTDMGTQKAFRIKKDSVTLFREKLKRKRSLKDWECESGICVIDECIPEECLEKIKARKGGETKRKKHRHSGTDGTQPKKVKKIDSRVQAGPGSAGLVTCECKPATKSVSSMTSFPKSLASIQSTTPESKDKKTKPPKQKQQFMYKETVIEERAYKTGRHAAKRTASYEFYQAERKQALPASKLGSIICECKPTTKSTSSMTSTFKKQTLEKEVKKKRPVTPRSRPQFVVKETVKQEKTHKTARHEKELVQVTPKSNLGHVICECKPITKSTSSMTEAVVPLEIAPKGKTSKSRSKIIKSKPKPQLLVTESVMHEKAHKTGRREKEPVQVTPKSNLENVTCECKPSTKSTPSMTTILKKRTLESYSKSKVKAKHEKPHKTVIPLGIAPKGKPSKTRSKVIKPRLQILVTESAIHEKAHNTGRREKEHIRVTPTYNLGNIICECKPSTRSIASMTIVPKTKASKSRSIIPKTKASKSRSKIIKPKKKPQTHREKQIVHSRSTSESGINIKEKKQKREKLRKKGRRKPKIEKYEHQHEIELPPEPERQAVKISSSFKFEIEFTRKRYPALNNRELIEHVRAKRAKRIQTHGRGIHYKKYQHSKVQVKKSIANQGQGIYLKESTSQASKPLKRKSVGSTTLSVSRSSKSRYIQSEHKDQRIKPREISKEIVKKDTSEVTHPNRQAVKISSSFQFNIEFYKENSPAVETDDIPDLSYEEPKKVKEKVHRKKKKERGHVTRNDDHRNVSSQSRSSQSFKNIQVGHKLKRCFCTLKLLQKKKQKVTYTVSKKTMAAINNKDFEKRARVRHTQTKSAGIAYVKPPVTATPASHLPCDCPERIIERNHKKRKEMKTVASQPLYKSSSRKMQSTENKYRKQKAPRSHTESQISSDRQAVRIGSSFNFNIEFSKTNAPAAAAPPARYQVRTPTKMVAYDKPRRIQQKGIMVHKPRGRHVESGATRNVQQVKQSHTKLFLHKCLCKLKLRKKNKNKLGTPLQNKNDNVVRMQSKSITAHRANVLYHHNHSKLLPYECEPGICIPNICDPYRCEKLIKLRNRKLQHKHSGTGDRITRSTFSETSRTINSSRSQNTQSFVKGSRDKEKKTNHFIKDSNDVVVTPSNSERQVVRVGSGFSFNIEFYKDTSSPNENIENEKKTELAFENKTRNQLLKKHKKEKLKRVGSAQINPRAHHKQTNAVVKQKDNGIYVNIIRKCLCTLKLQKSAKQKGTNKVVSKSTRTSYPLPNPQICDCKSTSTKISKPIKSYECAPNYCIPGLCNPYDCYEEIKRRETKRSHDRQIATDRPKRKSVISMTHAGLKDSSKTKSTQSKFLEPITRKDQNERVEPTHSFSPSRQGVRIGSNLSFHLEFSNDRSPLPFIQDTSYGSRIQTEREKGKKLKDKGINDKRVDLKHCVSQSNKIKKKDKASNVGFLLRRCFCTLGLQNKNTHLKKTVPKQEVRWIQPTTAQFVHVEQMIKNGTNLNGYNIIHSRNNIFNNNVYRRELVQSKLLENNHTYKEGMFNLNEFTKAKMKPRVNFNMNEHQVGYLMNPQKYNPYYQSFYALNVKVSKLKNNSAKTNKLEPNECEPGACVPYKCNPPKCLKLINNRLKHYQTGTAIGTGIKTKSVACTKKPNIASKSTAAKHSLSNHRRQKSPPTLQQKRSRGKRPEGSHSSHPGIRVGSGINIGLGFYKDTNQQSNDDVITSHTISEIDEDKNKSLRRPSLLGRCLCPILKKNGTNLKNTSLNNYPSGQNFRIGSNISIGMGFYNNKNQRSDDIRITSSHKRETKEVASRSLQNRPQQKSSGISNLLKFLCSKIKSDSKNVSDTDKTKKDTKPEKNNKKSKKETNKCTNDRKPACNFTSNINIKEGLNSKTKSTSILANDRKHFKAKTSQTKAQKLSTCSSDCHPKKRLQQKKSKKLEKRQTVRFGSDLNLSMEFYKYRTPSPHSPALSGTEYNQRLQVSPVTIENNRKKLKNKGQKAMKSDACTCTSKTKTFEECHPHDCNEKLAALGILKGKSKTKNKKVKKKTSPTNTGIYSKSTNTDITMKKQLKMKHQDTGTSMIIYNQEKNNFVKRCYCALQTLKGGKKLTTKPSTKRIVANNKKDPMKPALKLEKKRKQPKSEMKTIMPYSKKKFKKLESRLKFEEQSTNTSDLGACPCPDDNPKENFKTDHKKAPKADKIKKEDEVNTTPCPICRAREKKKKPKKSRHTCSCPDPNHTCSCPEQVGDVKVNPQITLNGKVPCPVCDARELARYGKRSKKSVEFAPRAVQNSSRQVMQNADQSEVCSCCQSKIEYIKKKITRFCKIDKIKSLYNNFLGEIGEKDKSMVSKPLIEMTVNKNNMNILNRDEVFSKLGSRSKVSRKARRAVMEGRIEPPLMEVVIDNHNANIIKTINYDKQKKKKSNLKSKSQVAPPTASCPTGIPVQSTKSERNTKPHGSKCKCCDCRKRRTKHKTKDSLQLNDKPRKLKPCICGSVVCKKDWDKLRKEQMSIKSLKINTCVCGSTVCREESQKMPELLLEAAQKAQAERDRALQAIKAEKLYQQERKRRKKIYAKEDRELWRKRRKEDRKDMKMVKKYNTGSDVLMIAESLTDLGKFGSKAFCDIMRSTCRVVRHPRDGVYHVKDAINKPSYAGKIIRRTIKGMGLHSTLMRIRQRVLKMRFTQKAVTKMESYPATNFLIHIADKDPKKRMKKFKQRRLREPLDFECSIFMASLRKRPCLRVYYMCPWFYPHCVGLLGVWKQFTDILLFILAVGVWSPCIFCMELCRAMVCCCLCTG